VSALSFILLHADKTPTIYEWTHYHPFAVAELKELKSRAEDAESRIKTLQEMYHVDHDERIRQEELIKQLRNEITYLSSTDHAADIAFEHAAPLDWRNEYANETPLGQALDGQGDEVAE
jgi:hypothetical protein